MISASIVLYMSSVKHIRNVIKSYAPSENKLLYLIDNSPVRTDIESFVANHDYIKYCFMGKNKGYGAGHNFAMRMAIEDGSDFHLVLNPDIYFADDVIPELLSCMGNDNEIVYILPKVTYPNGENQYLCKLLPTPSDLFFRRFVPNLKFIKDMNDRYILKHSGYNKTINPPCLSGCFMFLRMSVIKEYNIFFDERFFMYCEDVDFIRCLHRFGKTIYYPYVSIVHNHAKESYKSKKMLFEHIKSAIKYFNKWGWFFDRERAEMNKRILNEIAHLE